MSATFEIPFAIGEVVWWVGNDGYEVRITCPDCAGSRIITMVQGNGETVSLECACCARGYEGAFGYITQTAWDRKPVPFVCSRVSVDGDKVRYSQAPPDATAYQTVDAENLFRDKDACAVRCAELNAERSKWNAELVVRNVLSKRREMAWSAHYWGRKVKDLERDLAAAKGRLGQCKAPKVMP